MSMEELLKNPRIAKAHRTNNFSECNEQEREQYLYELAVSTGLNPQDQPFYFFKSAYGNQAVLAVTPRKNAAEQLAKINKISITIVSRETNEFLGLYIVTARATDPEGRTNERSGTVSLKNEYDKFLTGKNLVDATMKAETKAINRVVFATCVISIGESGEPEPAPKPTSNYYQKPVSQNNPSTPPQTGQITVKQIALIQRLLENNGLHDKIDEPGNNYTKDFLAYLIGASEITDINTLSRQDTQAIIDVIKSNDVKMHLNEWENSKIESNEGKQKLDQEMGKEL